MFELRERVNSRPFGFGFSKKRFSALFRVSIPIILTFLFIFAVVKASTTISTDINTGGSLTVTGTTRLNGVTYTWPSSESASTYLKNDGSGNLTWESVSSGTTINQLGQIGDVSTSTLAYGHLLGWDGSKWQDTATSSLFGTGTNGYVLALSSGIPFWVSTSSIVAGDTYGYVSWTAGGLIPDTCSGLLQQKSTNNQFDYLAFDGATDEYATFTWFPPDNWDRGTIKTSFIWAASAAMTNAHTVIWGLAGATVGDGITLANAITTGERVVSDAYATGDETGPIQKITAATPAITINGTHANGNPIYFRVHRDADTDTSTVDAWLIGIRIQYTKTTDAAW